MWFLVGAAGVTGVLLGIWIGIEIATAIINREMWRALSGL